MIMVSLLLRGWVGMVSVVSTVNAIMCFIHKDYPRERIYNKDNSQATALAARLFGVWTLLSSAIRMIFAISPSSSSSIFIITFFSFCLALFHFLSEVFIYRTSSLSVGTISPFVISGVSIIWMLVEYYFI